MITNKPQNIDKHNWYYEEDKGLTFVHEVVDDSGNYIKTDQFKVSWKMLGDSYERKYL